MPKTGYVPAKALFAALAKLGRLVIPRLVMHKPPPPRSLNKGRANRLSQTTAFKHAKHCATLKRRAAGVAGGLALAGGLAGVLGGLLGKKKQKKQHGGIIHYF